MANTRTVREILTAEWHSAGNTGPPTQDYIRQWRRANPSYGRWSLATRFYSGSLVPVMPDCPEPGWIDPDERATEFEEVREKRERQLEELRQWWEERRELEERLGIRRPGART